jgi:hypothetical protein
VMTGTMLRGKPDRWSSVLHKHSAIQQRSLTKTIRLLAHDLPHRFSLMTTD